MVNEQYRAFVRRAEQAASVAELRQVALEALSAHPDDPDAALIDETCFFHAVELLAQHPIDPPASPRYIYREPEVAEPFTPTYPTAPRLLTRPAPVV